MTDIDHCDEIRPLIHAMFDGELDAANRAHCEAHLSTCTACADELSRIKSLHQTLKSVPVSFAAPAYLHHRILSLLNQHKRASSSTSVMRSMRQWLWPLISAAVVLCVMLLVLPQFNSSTHEQLLDEVVASHVRSLEENHLMDIANSSQHVIKPWFAGRLDYSPRVIDLSAKGIELVGARLDYLQHRKVAALVYRYGAHVVNVFTWPDGRGTQSPRLKVKQGYNVAYWNYNGMSYWAVSDMNEVELIKLANELDS